jgi:hypothetical protein
MKKMTMNEDFIEFNNFNNWISKQIEKRKISNSIIEIIFPFNGVDGPINIYIEKTDKAYILRDHGNTLKGIINQTGLIFKEFNQHQKKIIEDEVKDHDLVFKDNEFIKVIINWHGIDKCYLLCLDFLNSLIRLSYLLI